MALTIKLQPCLKTPVCCAIWSAPGSQRWSPGMQIFEDPKHRFAILSRVGRLRLWFKPRGKNLQPPFENLELAGKKILSTKHNKVLTTYRITSLRRFSSATLPGEESKCFSNAIIRDKRFSILLLTVTVSCGSVRRRKISSRNTQTNLVGGKNNG